MNKFEFSPVVKAFRENIRKVSDSSAHFICGVSGGIDSMTLLYLLHRHDMNCTVVHCNYRLRGKASGKDRDLVEQMSNLWNFECITATFNPEEAEHENTQAWARDKRYQVFRDILEQTGANYILTAHHQTDQVETILQKVFRGAGLSAWKGMDLIEKNIVRPLLSVTKKQIYDFARSQQIPYREDKTNLSPGYARNFLRQEIFPEMDRLFPGWSDNILKLPQRAEEFSLMSDVLLSNLISDKNKLDREKLLKLPQKLWPVIIYRYFKKNFPDLTLTEGVINRFVSIDELQSGDEIELNEKWKIVRDRIHFLLVEREKSELEKQYRLNKEDLLEKPIIAGYKFGISDWNGKIKKNLLQADVDKLHWPLTIRRWREGDRIQCLGMKGSKKIADLLTDKKISSAQKRDAFLIESFDGIISAVIFPHITADEQPGIISEQVKCGSETTQILQINTDH